VGLEGGEESLVCGRNQPGNTSLYHDREGNPDRCKELQTENPLHPQIISDQDDQFGGIIIENVYLSSGFY
jgi:hypothetical protein